MFQQEVCFCKTSSCPERQLLSLVWFYSDTIQLLCTRTLWYLIEVVGLLLRATWIFPNFFYSSFIGFESCISCCSIITFLQCTASTKKSLNQCSKSQGKSESNIFLKICTQIIKMKMVQYFKVISTRKNVLKKKYTLFLFLIRFSAVFSPLIHA